ncbi:anti-sigma factor [Pedobacter yonginense]|uniref:Anti-sigma factor n=1 Tax=Pedobacter yonginense TaxID=651869 RepID=A0A317ENN4_9SPHI|nr:FecR family protein [Pedobacter yonginense]PWS27559.1 anti-sigma factor [Pedobacter yonginense]
MNKAEVEKLLQKYSDGLCTEQEKALVESWHLAELSTKDSDLNHADLIDAKNQIWNAIEEQTELKTRTRYALWLKVASAAVVLLFVGFVIKNQIQKQIPADENLSKITSKAIKPGGNKATLTLADGSKISLTDASNGIIAKQAGINITKTENGELIYTVAALSTSKTQNLFNIIETPRGGQYQVNLPDGTRVWLNAESSLKYPAVFNQSSRVVELKGEAYFEVAKLLSKAGNRVPFKVKSNLGANRNQEVEVLGTHFNINAYSDEPSSKTTLLEGSVRVANTSASTSNLLRPGQQSIISASSPSIIIKDVDAEEAVTWKDGFFSFNDENLETIMNKISRWYNVDIEYRGAKINKLFGGRISRFNSVNEVLETLQTTGDVHFKIEERRILVMP